MCLAVEQDEASDPAYMGLFSAKSAMALADSIALRIKNTLRTNSGDLFRYAHLAAPRITSLSGGLL